jgi:hypothetical protein
MPLTRRDLLKVAAAIGIPAAGQTPRQGGSRWAPTICSHLEEMALQGTDRYGPRKTPMWMASLDLRTKAYPESDPIALAGRRVYRDIASPFGSSIYWDQPQLVASHALSRLTGRPRYGKAADA